MRKSNLFVLAVAVASIGVLSTSAKAAVVFTIDGTDPDNLTIYGAGSLDFGTHVPEALLVASSVSPNQGILLIGERGPLDNHVGLTVTGPTNYGPGTIDGIGAPNGGILPGHFGFSVIGSALAVPEGYVNNTALSAGALYTGVSLADFGITPGTYNWNFAVPQSGGGFINNAVTLNVIPEPSSALIGGIGLLGLLARRRRCRA